MIPTYPISTLLRGSIVASVICSCVFFSCRRDEPENTKVPSMTWSCLHSDSECEQFEGIDLNEATRKKFEALLSTNCESKLTSKPCKPGYVADCLQKEPSENAVGNRFYFYDDKTAQKQQGSCSGTWTSQVETKKL